ncbi:hypothetical protein QQF64_033184 [Cirrhinus molitorella]|uniref:Uncharacterized protein n=1 Tax=Cirrhinus molitorella TaxID=172907 RepID=A0ABR3MT62_9TELE
MCADSLILFGQDARIILRTSKLLSPGERRRKREGRGCELGELLSPNSVVAPSGGGFKGEIESERASKRDHLNQLSTVAIKKGKWKSTLRQDSHSPRVDRGIRVAGVSQEMEPRSAVGSVITLGDVSFFFCPARERRCSCATSLQATANKWIFFFHLPISRILFYSPFTELVRSRRCYGNNHIKAHLVQDAAQTLGWDGTDEVVENELNQAGADEYDWHAGVSLHSYCAIFDALSVISRAKSLRAITVPYGICSTYVPLAAGSTTVHPTYACTSAAEPHFPGSVRIEVGDEKKKEPGHQSVHKSDK